MSTVVFDISISLGGFITASGRTADEHIQLETLQVIQTPAAIHTRYRVAPDHVPSRSPGDREGT